MKGCQHRELASFGVTPGVWKREGKVMRLVQSGCCMAKKLCSDVAS